MGDILLGVDVSVVKTAAEGPEFALGTLYTDPVTGYQYRYINADTAIANGDFLTPTLTDTDVPWSLVPAAAVKLIILGVAVSTIAAEGFGWMLVKGLKTLANIADAVVKGDMVGSSASAGRLDAITFTTTAATLDQLTAGFNALRGAKITPLTDGTASNTATVLVN